MRKLEETRMMAFCFCFDHVQLLDTANIVWC